MHACALKKYFSGTLTSKICDKVDSSATLRCPANEYISRISVSDGDSKVSRIDDTPSNTETVTDDLSVCAPLVRFRY